MAVFKSSNPKEMGLSGLSSFSSNCSPFGVPFVFQKIFLSSECVQEAIWKAIVHNRTAPSLRSGETSIMSLARSPLCFLFSRGLHAGRPWGAGPSQLYGCKSGSHVRKLALSSKYGSYCGG